MSDSDMINLTGGNNTLSVYHCSLTTDLKSRIRRDFVPTSGNKLTSEL